MDTKIGHRIIVVGNTGSGKSTLANELAHLTEAPHIELDSLFWKENWTETPDEEFLGKVRDTLTKAGNRWVIDGNYSRTRELIWPRADTLIWLDYPLHIIYWRLFWRTLQRTLSQQELWNGNHERFWTQFLSRESLFLWASQSHRRRKQAYNTIITTNEYPNLTIFHFTHPRKTDIWLRQLRLASHLS